MCGTAEWSVGVVGDGPLRPVLEREIRTHQLPVTLFGEAGDTETLAARLSTHLRDPSSARERSPSRRARVRSTFTIDRAVDRWLSLYSGAQR